MILVIVGLTGISAGAIPIVVSGQNMTGNMTGGQNTTADINQTGSISGTSQSSQTGKYQDSPMFRLHDDKND
jgi:hypothetical protein